MNQYRCNSGEKQQIRSAGIAAGPAPIPDRTNAKQAATRPVPLHFSTRPGRMALADPGVSVIGLNYNLELRWNGA